MDSLLLKLQFSVFGVNKYIGFWKEIFTNLQDLG